MQVILVMMIISLFLNIIRMKQLKERNGQAFLK